MEKKRKNQGASEGVGVSAKGGIEGGVAERGLGAGGKVKTRRRGKETAATQKPKGGKGS